MPIALQAKRQTGRTGRLLQEAKRLKQEGRAVYIIAATQRHAQELQRCLPPGTGIKVETPGSCGNFDWETLTLRGAHPNCVTLVDHYAIEHHQGHLLQAWTRFDD